MRVLRQTGPWPAGNWHTLDARLSNERCIPAQMFSRRLPPDAVPNALSRRVDQLRATGAEFVDLTESNPTRAGFVYPPDLLKGFSSAQALHYDPHPVGLPAARQAVADEYARRGVAVNPAHVVLTASTSEAYSWLFKLLCNPGERVVIPRPSYPLFSHLTRLEGIKAAAYDLDYHRRWDIDFGSVERAIARETRALLVVSPNNPTGSYVSKPEAARLCDICAERGLALIADEVFVDYVLDGADPTAGATPNAATDATTGAATDIALQERVLAFTLGGLSKAVGLPQLKLGWILVGGPPASRDAAIDALAMIADSYLSVSTPVQVAAPDLLASGRAIREQIHSRVRHNLSALRAAAGQYPSCQVLVVEGGWSAVVRVPAARSEEALALELLERERILVHPGYFFDFPREAYVIVSLLPRTDIFVDAVARMLRLASY